MSFHLIGYPHLPGEFVEAVCYGVKAVNSDDNADIRGQFFGYTPYFFNLVVYIGHNLAENRVCYNHE